MDETTWPDGFPDIGGKTFAWVLEHRKEWVNFTLDKMENPSGFFLKWKTYLLNRKQNAKRKKRLLQQTSDQTGQGDHAHK